MAYQEVMIIGATGNVGSELVRQIEEHDVQGHNNPTRIVGMANTRGMLVDPRGIRHAADLTDRTAFAGVSREYKTLGDIVAATKDAGLEGEVIFVDATADKSPTMLALHRQIVETRQRMVTANKNPLSLFGAEDFEFLTADRTLYRYNASVMAGGDAVPFLQDARDLNERVESVRGCFSGTLGYICSALDEGRTFSEVVREACDKKYTEPHPWDDLNGLDVARKLLILARSAGFAVEMKDIKVEPLISASYGEIADVREFLEALRAEDAAFKDRIDASRETGAMLRYVAEMTVTDGVPALSVGLKPVSRETSIGRLRGTANLVEIVTDQRAPKESPHVIQAKGAGIEKTAAAIRADLLRMLPNRKHG